MRRDESVLRSIFAASILAHNRDNVKLPLTRVAWLLSLRSPQKRSCWGSKYAQRSGIRSGQYCTCSLIFHKDAIILPAITTTDCNPLARFKLDLIFINLVRLVYRLPRRWISLAESHKLTCIRSITVNYVDHPDIQDSKAHTCFVEMYSWNERWARVRLMISLIKGKEMLGYGVARVLARHQNDNKFTTNLRTCQCPSQRPPSPCAPLRNDQTSSTLQVRSAMTMAYWKYSLICYKDAIISPAITATDYNPLTRFDFHQLGAPCIMTICMRIAKEMSLLSELYDSQCELYRSIFSRV